VSSKKTGTILGRAEEEEGSSQRVEKQSGGRKGKSLLKNARKKLKGKSPGPNVSFEGCGGGGGRGGDGDAARKTSGRPGSW